MAARERGARGGPKRACFSPETCTVHPHCMGYTWVSSKMDLDEVGGAPFWQLATSGIFAHPSDRASVFLMTCAGCGPLAGDF